MTDHDDPNPEERFLDIADGDAGLAKLLHDSLTKLRDGAVGKDLQEMARDVLAGRADLREIGGSDAYGSALGERFRQFNAWYNGLTPDEREQLVAEAVDHARTLDQQN